MMLNSSATLARRWGCTPFFGDGNKRRRVGLLEPLHSQHHKPASVSAHLARNLVEAEIEYAPGRSLFVLGVHPVAMLAWPFECWRWLEARYIVSRARRYADAPCLIAGDFNAIAPGDRMDTQLMPQWLRWMILLQGNRVYRQSIRAYLSAGFTDCFRRLNPDDHGFTLPPPRPNTRLDYIFANSILTPHLKSCQVVREPAAVLHASDHYPVVAEFDLANDILG